jgi:hypothetical protein
LNYVNAPAPMQKELLAHQAICFAGRNLNQMTKVSDKSDAPDPRQETFATLLDFAEHIAKAFTVFVGTIYVIGYIVTATRLAQYGVPTIRLLDAQYLAAGLLPGLMLWLTILVAVSAFFYKDRDGILSLKLVGVAVGILFIISVALEFVVIPFSWITVGRSVLNTCYITARFAMGALALWFLIAGLRTKYFSDLIIFFRDKGKGAGPVYVGFVYLAGLVVIGALILIPRLAWQVYNGLPQAYGGGKPLRIELYVDSTKVPSELLAPQSGTTQAALVRTIHLNLILKTSTEYVVRPLADSDQRTWVLKTDVVHAEYAVEGDSP